jgi:hypothetical protein
LSPVSMMVFTKVFGMTTEEVEVMLVEVGKDMENRESEAYIKCRLPFANFFKVNFHTYYPMQVNTSKIEPSTN